MCRCGTGCLRKMVGRKVAVKGLVILFVALVTRCIKLYTLFFCNFFSSFGSFSLIINSYIFHLPRQVNF